MRKTYGWAGRVGLSLFLLAGASACSAQVEPPYWAEVKDSLGSSDPAADELRSDADTESPSGPESSSDEEATPACLGESCDPIEMSEFSTAGKTGGFGHSAEPAGGDEEEADIGGCGGDLVFHGPLLEAHGSPAWIEAFETALDGGVSGPFAVTFSLPSDEKAKSTLAQIQGASGGAEIALLEEGSSHDLELGQGASYGQGSGQGVGQRRVNLDRSPTSFHFVLSDVLIPVVEVSVEGTLKTDCSAISGAELHLFVPAAAGSLELEGQKLIELWGEPEAEILGEASAGWDLRLSGALVQGVAQ